MSSYSPSDITRPSSASARLIQDARRNKASLAAAAAVPPPIAIPPSRSVPSDSPPEEPEELKSHIPGPSRLRTSPSPSRLGSTTGTGSCQAHIFEKTNTERTLTSRLLNPTTSKPNISANEKSSRSSHELSAKDLNGSQSDQVKSKKKGGSLLSRLSMIGGKKRDDDIFDDGSEISTEQRTEGANAVAFSFAVDCGGFIPHHKEPPRFIRVRAHDKKLKEFNRVFLAQELVGTCPQAEEGARRGSEKEATIHGYRKQDPNSGGPIWAIEFSKDGKYLATGGRDRVLRVWGVLATPEDRQAFEEEENAADAEGKQQRLSAPVFHTKPIREFVGHTGDILDLSWSKNNFLLSSSMDRTVRLWHLSRPECLCTFKHNDFVTSIAFHPRDDRFFLAGSLDANLRLWSIPDKSVAYSTQLSDTITAVAFSPDGKTAITGCLNGLCMFYETVGLKYQTQIHVRSSRGKNARGSKITGIRTLNFPPEAPDGQVRVLITSNDSRIRIYDLQDKTLQVKIKGHENSCNQIKASFSDDGKYIICGSEDRKAFIWSTGATELDKDDTRPYEYFEAHAHAVTEAVFAPTQTRQLLQSSNDPVYTLCNPPPVTLLSREEIETESLPPDGPRPESAHIKRPGESPAFIARSTHCDGNIIVTTDHSGSIKVFRQDCAFAKRRQAMENWETGSVFSKKLAKDGFLSRTTTRGSDPTSGRVSLSQTRRVLSAQVNTDRIDSWRYGVHRQGLPSYPGSAVSVSASVTTPTASERSVSPSKAGRIPLPLAWTSGAADQASKARNPPYADNNASDKALSIMHPLSPATSHSTGGGKADERPSPKEVSSSSRFPPTPSFSFQSVDEATDGDAWSQQDQAGASPSFWNLNRWRNMASPGNRSASGVPGLGIILGGGQKGQQNGAASAPDDHQANNAQPKSAPGSTEDGTDDSNRKSTTAA
ncbi:hypothetical protein DL766_000512 [Monosporascus sp. MC13-8B]|nr:hypothetical protein DL763_010492 [Monosporascus cannonballus]RYP39254.1 hypothetical protein DL766_000512 [Monosporascus sp. MC13-8B]